MHDDLHGGRPNVGRPFFHTLYEIRNLTMKCLNRFSRALSALAITLAAFASLDGSALRQDLAAAGFRKSEVNTEPLR